MASNSRSSRQRWSDAFKKRVVVEASQPGASATEIAHRYHLDPRRISVWKAKFSPPAALVPVEVTAGDRGGSPSCVEVDLPCGTKLRCGPDTNTELVAGIIVALRSKR